MFIGMQQLLQRYNNIMVKKILTIEHKKRMHTNVTKKELIQSRQWGDKAMQQCKYETIIRPLKEKKIVVDVLKLFYAFQFGGCEI